MSDREPVSVHVIWEPPDMPDLRLIRAIEVLIDYSATSLPQMNDEQIDAALAYVINRRAAIARTLIGEREG